MYASNRKARRVFVGSLGKGVSAAANYFKYVCFFDNEIEFLISKSHKDLAAFANIEEHLIENTIDYHLEKNPAFMGELMGVTVHIRRALKYETSDVGTS